MDGESARLRDYYRRWFPAGAWCRWLAAGCAPQPLRHREVSVTLAGDVYVRYQSVRRAADLRELLERKCPRKIDVGAVYDAPPRRDARLVARELVFDVDLTDYDEVRACCRGADACDKCWKYAVIACRVLDAALRDDFGFSGLLWVYSGRRGMHCWVSCAEARSLTCAARAAVAGYLSVLVGGESQAKKVRLDSDRVHSSVRRALEIIEPLFEGIVDDQSSLSTPERLSQFAKLIPDDAFASRVRAELEALPPDSVTRWRRFEELYAALRPESGNRKLKHLREEIKLQWCYPRLDVNVTKGMNHLLKAPFSVHPKTEKVCVTFRASDVAEFAPNDAPALADLLDDQSPNHARAVRAMQNAVELFQNHVFTLEKTEANDKRTAAEAMLDF